MLKAQSTWTWKQRHSGSFPNVFCFKAPPSTCKMRVSLFEIDYTKILSLVTRSWLTNICRRVSRLTAPRLRKMLLIFLGNLGIWIFAKDVFFQKTKCQMLCYTAPGGGQGESDIVEGVIGHWARSWGGQSRCHLELKKIIRWKIQQFSTLQVINPVKGVWHLGLVKEETTLLGSSLPSLHITPELDLRLRRD